MASFEARDSLRSAHPLSLLANRVVSLTLFVALLCGGFVVLNYIRTELQGGPSRSEASSVSVPAIPTTSHQQAQVLQRLSSDPARLVYSCPSDSDFYHTSTHLQHCKRTALSEDAAVSRGLKRCPVCLPN